MLKQLFCFTSCNSCFTHIRVTTPSVDSGNPSECSPLKADTEVEDIDEDTLEHSENFQIDLSMITNKINNLNKGKYWNITCLYIVTLLFLTLIQTWTILYFWKTTLVLDQGAILQYHQKEEAILKNWLITLLWTFIGTFQTYLCLFMINVRKVRNIHHLLGSTKMYNGVIVTILTSTWLIWTSWETSSLLMFGRIWMLDTCR